MAFRDTRQLYFQAQFITLRTEAIDMLYVFPKHKNNIKCKNYENIGPPLHDKLNQKRDFTMTKFVLGKIKVLHFETQLEIIYF